MAYNDHCLTFCRYKNVERQPWVAPCNVREVGNLMSDLKNRGMDLAAFEAKELFEVIKGRTLWCADKLSAIKELDDLQTESPHFVPVHRPTQV